MTDERVPEEKLLAAIAELPSGAGIVFRHHVTLGSERRALFCKIRTITRRRRLALICAGSDKLLHRLADGRHIPARHSPPRLPCRKPPYLLTVSVHNAQEIARANRLGAALVFLSPVYPTRSHRDARRLGPIRFAALARTSAVPVIALGGMNRERFRRIRPFGAYGWAAIEALTPSEK